MLPTKDSFQIQGHTQDKRERMEKISHRNGNQRTSAVAILILDKIDFKLKKTNSNKRQQRP